MYNKKCIDKNINYKKSAMQKKNHFRYIQKKGKSNI